IHGPDLALAQKRLGTGHKLVHAAVPLWNLVDISEACEKIVGIEYRVLAHRAKTRRPQRPNVTVTAYQDADVAKEAAHTPDGLWTIIVQLESGRRFLDHRSG